MGGEVTFLDKSAFFRTKRSFKYEYGRNFRDENPMNSDHAVFEINDFLKQMKCGRPLGSLRYMLMIY